KQEYLRQLAARVDPIAPGCQNMQVLIEPVPLSADDLVGIDLVTVKTDHQLDEKLVAMVLGGDAGAEPVGQLCAADRRQAVDSLFRTAVLLNAILAHKPGLFETRQGSIDLGRFHVPNISAPDKRLKRRPQLVSMPGLLGKQSEDGITN